MDLFPSSLERIAYVPIFPSIKTWFFYKESNTDRKWRYESRRFSLAKIVGYKKLATCFPRTAPMQNYLSTSLFHIFIIYILLRKHSLKIRSAVCFFVLLLQLLNHYLPEIVTRFARLPQEIVIWEEC